MYQRLTGLMKFVRLQKVSRRRSGRCFRRRDHVEELEIRQLLAADVRLIKDIAPGSPSSSPSQLTDVDGNLFFTAEATAGDVELWTSDGTALGTKLVKDILPGPNGASPRELTSVNGILYFSARNVLNAGFELWRSDGTESGTFMVKDIRPGDSGAQLDELTDVNGTLFFSATNGTSGMELWKSDGTAAGTVLVKDIRPGSGNSNPKHLTNVNGTLFFAATDGVHGTELWKSDGTADGTVMVEDSVVGDKGANPAYLTDVNGTLFYTSFFNANQGLWKSDGTEGGTMLVRGFTPVPNRQFPDDGMPSELTNVGGTLFFRAADAANGQELWKSNGTTDGTQLVRNIFPGSDSAYPESFLDYNGILIFTVANNRRFFRSDGTAAGTFQFTSVNPGPTRPESVLHDDLVYLISFRNTNAGQFFDLWKSNGTSAGTFLEYASQTSTDNGGAMRNFLSVDGTLYFQAGESPFGRELWALNQFHPPDVIQPATFTTSTRPTITWSEVPGAVSYEIRISDLTLGVADFIRETVAGTTFTPSVDFGLGRYSVIVRSTDAGGQKSGWSRPYEFRNYLRVTLQTLDRFQTTARPTITWDALQGVAKYDLWIDNITTGQSQVIRNTNVMGTSFTPDVDLPMGVYRVWVRGITADGITGFFSTANEFVVVPAPTINGPLNSTFSRQPEFSWNAVAGAVRYEIVLRDANTGQNIHTRSDLVATTWTPPADLPVGPYRWWVSAVSADGFRSAAPVVVDFFVGGRTEILSPIGSTTDSTPTFTWRPVDGAAAFRVVVDRIDGDPARVIDVTSIVSTTSFTPTTPLAPGTYRVWLLAIGTFGESGVWSKPVDFQVTDSTFDLPAPLLLAGLAEDMQVNHSELQRLASGFAVIRRSPGDPQQDPQPPAAEAGQFAQRSSLRVYVEDNRSDQRPQDAAPPEFLGDSLVKLWVTAEILWPI
jgi:ELWxxDGT repeat protein